MGVFDVINPAAFFWISISGMACVYTIKIMFDFWFYAAEKENRIAREKAEIDKIRADAEWKRWRSVAIQKSAGMPYPANGVKVYTDVTPEKKDTSAGQGRGLVDGDGSYSLSDRFFNDPSENEYDENDISEMFQNGISKTAIAEKVYGNKGGWQLKNIKNILASKGIHA